MHTVVARAQLSPNVTRLVIQADRIAQIRQPGQFVIVRRGPGAERIPLTIADSDPVAGTITLVIQAIGEATSDLTSVEVGDVITDVAGPLGKATEILASGRAVCVGGGVGTAVVHPIAQALAARGVDVTSVIGGRSREWVIFEDELRRYGDVVVCTDDGSYGRHGFVTQALEELCKAGGIDEVYAVGPVPMMRAVSEVTRPFGIKTTVSLNAIMVDGTGMCGGCRVVVDGKTQYACVDGPEFDGHQVDFKQLADRLGTYRDQEQSALQRWAAHPTDGSRVTVSLEARRASHEPLPKKERMQIGRHTMPEQHPILRAHNFDEVNLGFTEELAILEADRCLQCPKPYCVDGCPVSVNIPNFIRLLGEGDISGAARSLLADNALPCVTGRVCPQESQCEGVCLRGKTGDPVAIGALERYVADWAMTHPDEVAEPAPAPTGKRVAIVGSGPAGLTAAGELTKRGHEVTVFEAFHQAGGVLTYGIPEFRLPKRIVAKEVERLESDGVEVQPNSIIGKTFTLPELRRDYDAVFVAVGAGLPVFMDVPGENLKGVYSANEYLTRVNLMGAYDPASHTPILRGRRVAVVGGGNVAMDSVRTALRLGAAEAICVYRRSRDELPARAEEAHHAEQEGVRFELLTAPVEVVGDEQGWVTGLRCIRMELGEPDASGRRRPVEVPGSEFVIPCDMVVVAIGTKANPVLTSTSPELTVNRRGYVETDQAGQTSMGGVFAGGDIVRGAATVILAMGDGKRAAASIDAYLRGEPVGEVPPPEIVGEPTCRLDALAEQPAAAAEAPGETVSAGTPAATRAASRHTATDAGGTRVDAILVAGQ